MSEELKPCPFCGGPASEAMWPGHVGCLNSDCGAYKANLSIAAWNRRASPTPPTTEGREKLTKLLRRTKQTLCVPAAEYVPAMGDAMLLLDRAIQMSYQTDPNWLSPPDGDGKQEQATRAEDGKDT